MGNYLGTQSLLTLEIDPESKLIVQACGKCNRAPNLNEFKFLIHYCVAKGFELSSSIIDLFDEDEFGTNFKELKEKELSHV